MDIREKINLFSDRTLELAEDLAKEDTAIQLSVICALVDYIASANGVRSVDLVDRLRPFIADVNEEFGAYEIKGA